MEERTYTYGYDDQGREILQTYSVRGNQLGKTQCAYDVSGFLSKMVYTEGDRTTTYDYRYDENGCKANTIITYSDGGSDEYFYRYEKVNITLNKARQLQAQYGEVNVVIAG